MKIIRIPYKGGKQAISLKLINEMSKHKPNAKYFIDLFGGGGSMSFTAHQLGYKVLYNEYDTNLYSFVDYCLNKTTKGKYGIFPDDWYKFVTKEEFIKQKELDTPFAEFCRIVYSFGNNRRGYLFSPKNEEYKHYAHNVVVYQCHDSLKAYNDILGIEAEMCEGETINERRLDFKQKTYHRYNKRLDLEQLQQLESLQQLEQLEQLELNNKSYDDVDLSKYNDDEVIIYCDPPYRGTDKYLKDFDHKKFDEWFAKQEYLIFLSEYEAPFNKIFSVEKRVTYSPSDSGNKKQESLFINKDRI